MTDPKNPRPLGFPISILADEVFENLRQAEAGDAARAARRNRSSGARPMALRAVEASPGSPRSHAGQVPTRQDDRFRASYLVGDTTPSGVDLSNQDISGPMMLAVTDIDCYDHNPRLFLNDKREDIRHSIASTGFQDALVVTRRRVGDRFMLAAGSNTTLLVLQDLFRETQDDKYRWVNCIFQPYQDDTRVLAQHLGENLNRGDMRFWEIAKGMTDLLDMIAADRRQADPGAKKLGLREQADELTRRGLRAEKSLVALWRFAVRQLPPLGPALQALSLRAVRDHLQPRTNALRGLALKFKLDEQAFWSTVVAPTLDAYGRTFERDPTDTLFDAPALCDRIELAFAEKLDESVATVRQMLSTLKLSPELTLAELRQPSPNMMFGTCGAAALVASATDAETGAAAGPVAQEPDQPADPGEHCDDQAPPAPAPPQGLPQPSPKSAGTTQTVTTGLPPDAPTDALLCLRSALQNLLASAGLSDTLRWRDEMPLGFYVELPNRETHLRGKTATGSVEHQQRKLKTLVWWSLVLMTGQFRSGCQPYLDPNSEFFRHFGNDANAQALLGTDIEQNPPELDEMLLDRVRPGPLQAVMPLMRIIEEQAARVFEQSPTRWRRMLEVCGLQA